LDVGIRRVGIVIGSLFQNPSKRTTSGETLIVGSKSPQVVFKVPVGNFPDPIPPSRVSRAALGLLLMLDRTDIEAASGGK